VRFCMHACCELWFLNSNFVVEGLMHVLLRVMHWMHVMRTNLWCRYAVQAMTSAYAMFDFGFKHNKTAMTWSTTVADTYPVAFPFQHLLNGAAMIAWAHRCENKKLPLCNDNKALRWLAVAEQQWEYQVVRFIYRTLARFRCLYTCFVYRTLS
jgi:hypothetical protein